MSVDKIISNKDIRENLEKIENKIIKLDEIETDTLEKLLGKTLNMIMLQNEEIKMLLLNMCEQNEVMKDDLHELRVVQASIDKW